jgi:hypothetical protein
MDAAGLLKLYLSEHPLCRVCGKAATTVREKSNPHWGLDPDNNYSPRETIDDWLIEVNPENIDGVCDGHLKVARSGNGGWIDPQASTKSGNWMKDAQRQRLQARNDLITALGGVCQVCRQEFPNEEMRVIAPDKIRRELHMSPVKWWEYVRKTPQLLAAASLLCVGCTPLQTSSNPSNQGARERVIQDYGGVCWHPDCRTTEGLMVASKPGTPPLRWPNGDKYTSVAKLQYLARHGCPDGWTVTCGRHQRELQRRG